MAAHDRPEEPEPPAPRPDRRARLRFSTGRHPRDLLQAVLAFAITALSVLVAARGAVDPVEAAIAQQLRRLPAETEAFWEALGWWGTPVAIAVAALVLVYLERYRMALTVAAGGTLAFALASLLQGVIDPRPPPEPLAPHAVLPPEASFPFPAVSAAIAAAIANAAAPYLGRLGRGLAAAGVVGVAVADVFLGRQLPLDVFAGAFLGMASAAVLHLVLGAPGRRVGPDLAVQVLASAGLDIARISRRPGRWQDPVWYDAWTTEDEQLVLKVVHRRHRRLGLWYQLRRMLGSMGVETEPRLSSPWHEADHEAVVASLAERAGVRTPGIAVVVALDHGPAILVRRATPGRRPSELPAGDLRGRWLADLWRQVGLLGSARIAHRDLRDETLRVDGEHRVWVLDFASAAAAATLERRAQDVAEVLVFLAPLIGVEPAVDSAVAHMDADVLQKAAPYLHPLALPGRIRAQLRDDRPTLAELRETLADRLGVAALSPGWPVRPTTLVSLGLLGLAVYVLLPQVATLPEVLEQARHAEPGWVVAVVVASALTLPLSALGLAGASPRALPFWRTTLVQLAAAFAARVTPAGVGLVAVNYLFLERLGLPRPVAAGAVALNRAAGAAVAGAGVGIGILLLGTSPALQHVPVPPFPALLVAVAMGLVGLAIADRFDPVRRAVRRSYEALREVAATVRQPVRALQLLGGLAGFLVVHALALVASLAAFEPELSVPTTMAVFLVGGILGSAAPTPGGLGAVEAALVAGLTATGVAASTAVAGVLLYRLATFWLPLAAGPLVVRVLGRQGVL